MLDLRCTVCVRRLLNGDRKGSLAEALPTRGRTSQRSDGTTQVLYKGHPLYAYAGDPMAADTNGEGLNSFGAGWDVLTPAGKKIEKPGS